MNIRAFLYNTRYMTRQGLLFAVGVLGMLLANPVVDAVAQDTEVFFNLVNSNETNPANTLEPVAQGDTVDLRLLWDSYGVTEKNLTITTDFVPPTQSVVILRLTGTQTPVTTAEGASPYSLYGDLDSDPNMFSYNQPTCGTTDLGPGTYFLSAEFGEELASIDFTVIRSLAGLSSEVSDTDPLAVQFTATPDNTDSDAACETIPDPASLTYSWDFGESATSISTDQNPQFTYAQGGTYTVSLTVTPPNGAAQTYTQTVTVTENLIPPVADFTSLSNGLTVAFEDLSSDEDGDIVAWAWDFGENATSTSTEQNPQYSYGAEGQYTVTLTVTDNDGLTASVQKEVEVSPNPLPPVAAFSTQQEGLSVTFVDESSDPDGNIVSWAWDFGENGNTSTDQNPVYMYSSPGDYSVTLTVIDDQGLADAVTNTITVQARPPIANFNFTTAGLQASFEDTSESPDGEILSWSWDFGDNEGTSTEQNPVYTYAVSGVYTVTLTVTDTYGENSVSRQVPVSPDNFGPVAAFSSVVMNLDVAFTDASVDFDGDITEWQWDFGDGSVSTAQNPSHTYAKDSTYTVSLTVTDDDQAGGSTSQQITVMLANEGPTADFAADTSGQFTYIFTDLSTDSDGMIVSRVWDFGDGTVVTSATDSVTHVFAGPGRYPVMLKVTDDQGATGSRTEVIVIEEEINTPPVAAFNAVVNELAVSFTDQSVDPDGSVDAWVWDFGDGAISEEQNPQYTYEQSGSYLVSLLVTDNEGAVDSTSQLITVSDGETTPVVAAFSSTANGLIVSFEDQSAPDSLIALRVWDFGDGTVDSTNAVMPEHTYMTDSTYTVTLTVVDVNDLVWETSQSVTVQSGNVGPVASFSLELDGFMVTLTDESTDSDGMIAGRIWDYGDGTVDSTGAEMVKYSYGAPGTYAIKLTVVDDDGATGSTTAVVTIEEDTNTPPVAAFNAVVNELAVSFFDQSVDPDGSVDAWAWDFGDGASSVEQNPEYIFSQSGTYTVSLLVTDNEGAVDSTSQQITVTDGETTPVVVAFNSTANGLTVNFEDQSAPDSLIASRVWDFGDGTADSTSTATPEHTYGIDSTYTVTLTVVDVNEFVWETSQSVTVQSGNVGPVALFSLELNGFTVTLTDESSDADGMIAGRIWDYGDGTVDSTGAEMVEYTYGAPGTYAIKLTVVDDDGATGTTTSVITIEEDTNMPPVAAFNAVVNELLVSFTDQSVDPDGSVDAWQWAFGDGSTSIEQNPEYTYSRSGTYTVSLLVTDSEGAVDSTGQIITVIDGTTTPVVAAFSSSASGLTVNFEDQSAPDSLIASRVWDFGDGTADSTDTLTPSHTYAVDSTYTVTLAVVDVNDLVWETSQSVTVQSGNVGPVASFSLELNGFTVTLTDESTDADGMIAGRIWDFGDGTVDSTGAEMVEYTYTAAGTYAIKLTVIDDDGATGSTTTVITIEDVVDENIPPVAAFNAVVNDLAVSFTDQSVDPDGSVDAWVWNFGDGATSEEQNPQYTYGQSGSYLVSLLVTDNEGAVDSTSQLITVNDGETTPVVAAFSSTANGLTVSFEDQSAPDSLIALRVWDFGDGTVDSTNAVMPEHTYQTDSTYTVTLSVVDVNEFVWETNQLVTVQSGNVGPVASFSLELNGFTVTLTDESTDADGMIAGRIWDFGDGTVDSTGAEMVEYTYTAAGTYAIKLTVIDDDGATGSTTTVITLEENTGGGIAFTLPDQILTIGSKDTDRINLDEFFEGVSGGSLSYSAQSADEAIATVEMESANILLLTLVTLDPDQTGNSTTITIDAANSEGSDVSAEFEVFANRAPLITPPQDRFIASFSVENAGFSTPVDTVSSSMNTDLDRFSAIDPDGDALTLTATSSDPRVAFVEVNDGANGSLSLEIEPLDFGVAFIELHVSDGVGGENAQGFEVIVSQLGYSVQHSEPVIDAPLIITVSVTGGLVPDMTMQYRKGGELAYSSNLSAEQVGETSFAFAIPAEDVTINGLSYRLNVQQEDGTLVTTMPDETLAIRIEDGLTAPLGLMNTVKERFKLFSLPLELDQKNIVSMLADDLGPYSDKVADRSWRVFDFLSNGPASGVYLEPADGFELNMRPGKAYWITTENEPTTYSTGAGSTLPLKAEPFEIPLNPGWNLVGNPFGFTVPFSNVCQVETDASRQVPLEFNLYDPTNRAEDPVDRWRTANVLDPYDGYAVFSAIADTLLVYPFEVDEQCTRPLDQSEAAASMVWSIDVIAQTDEGMIERGTAVVAEKSSAEWDIYDKPERPVIGEYVSVRFNHPDWEGKATRYRQDARPVFEDGDVWNVEVAANTNDAIQVTFEGIKDVPAHYTITLVDPLLGILQDVRQDAVYDVGVATESHPRLLKLIVGEPSYQETVLGEMNLIPEAFELSQNFPNPFNQATTIPYALPEDASVSIHIYDMLGRKMVTVAEDLEQKAGRHAFVWSGKNDAGQEVASGVYFIHFQAGSFVQTRKTILVK